MSIIAGEIIFRKSATNDDTSANGGRMSTVSITSGSKNNVWPDTPQSERITGSTKYRKLHIHIANDADLALVRPRVFVETQTPGDDSVTFFPGTHTDVQSSITGSERQYGTGKLNADVAVAATAITVLTEGASLNYLRNGDLVRISNKTSVDDAVGTEDYVTINSAPTYSGSVASFVVTPALTHAYTAALTRVAAVYQAADTVGIISGLVKTLGGTFDAVLHPILVDSIGGIYQTWTLTFSSATVFTVVGDTVGSVGSGNVSSDFQPTNSSYSKPYFVLPATAWGGTQVTGNTLTWITAPASIPIWEKRTIPAGANSLSGNKVIIGIDGESS